MTDLLRPYTQDQTTGDVAEFLPMLERVEANTAPRPAAVFADAGYFSGANVPAQPTEREPGA
jgi:hypothetical protein